MVRISDAGVEPRRIVLPLPDSCHASRGKAVGCLLQYARGWDRSLPLLPARIVEARSWRTSGESGAIASAFLNAGEGPLLVPSLEGRCKANAVARLEDPGP